MTMDYNDKITAIYGRLKGPRYKDMPYDTIKSSLVVFLSKQYRRKGQAVSDTALVETVDLLDGDISGYYGKVLSYPEVELAIDWGLHGEYGEFTGMNADRLFRFVRNYVESPERQEAIKRAKVLAEQPAKSGTDDGRRNWDSLFLKTGELWRDFLERGTVRLEADGSLYPLATIRRHIAGDCYRWLKMTGLVADDGDTAELERRSYEKASAIVRKENGSHWDGLNDPIKALAGTMMLENVFAVMRAQGYDLPGELQRLEQDTPQQERAYY